MSAVDLPTRIAKAAGTYLVKFNLPRQDYYGVLVRSLDLRQNTVPISEPAANPNPPPAEPAAKGGEDAASTSKKGVKKAEAKDKKESEKARRLRSSVTRRRRSSGLCRRLLVLSSSRTRRLRILRRRSLRLSRSLVSKVLANGTSTRAMLLSRAASRPSRPPRRSRCILILASIPTSSSGSLLLGEERLLSPGYDAPSANS